MRRCERDHVGWKKSVRDYSVDVARAAPMQAGFWSKRLGPGWNQRNRGKLDLQPRHIKRRRSWDSEKARYSGLSVCHCRSFCSLRCSCTIEETNAAVRQVNFFRDVLDHSVIAKRVTQMIGAGTTKSGRSRSHIDINDPAAVRRWSRHLRLTKIELLSAVDKVGNSVVAVRKQVNLVERR
jgi:hypothetical protein